MDISSFFVYGISFTISSYGRRFVGTKTSTKLHKSILAGLYRKSLQLGEGVVEVRECEFQILYKHIGVSISSYLAKPQSGMHCFVPGNLSVLID